MAQVIKTKMLEVVKASNSTKESIEKKIERSLANPINSKAEGDTFNATLTGDIQISQFGDRKSAHLLTKEGYRISVPANFDKNTHKANAVVNCVCMVAEMGEGEAKRKIKYTSIVA